MISTWSLPRLLMPPVAGQYLVTVSVGDDDLADMDAALQIPECIPCLVKGKDPVDHRPKAVDGDCPVHRLEHLPGTDENSLEPYVFHEHGRGIKLPSAPRKHSDERNATPDPYRLERFRQRPAATHF